MNKLINEIFSKLIKSLTTSKATIATKFGTKKVASFMTLSKSLFSSLALYSICSVALAGYLQVNVLDKDGKPVPDAVVFL